MSVVSMMDRLRARVAEQRRQEAELEALGPGAVEAARRERAKREAERIAADRAAHEAEQEAGLVSHLERCGMGSLDAQRVAGGLSDTWGWVDVPGRDGSPQKRVQALAAVRDWWRGSAPLLFLFGAPGTGKTLAAGWLLSQLRLEYHHPDWGPTWCWPSTVSETGIFALARELASSPLYGSDADRLRERLTRCRLLVLDELGTEIMTDPWQSLCDTVVVRRHAAGLRTVLLSNVSGKDFTSRYGSRISRRIREDGKAVSLGSETLSGKGRP